MAETLPTTYDPRQVEMARYKIWKDARYFRALPDPKRRAWAVMMPLPNVTGELHIGHALNNGLQDVLTRFKRMQGFNALYQPGTDHAGIATQNVVERALAKEGIRREALGREKFQERVWGWVRKYGGIIYSQLERLGISCDWDRKVFTLDPTYYDAVMEAFVRLYGKGLITRGTYMVNWCPHDGSVISALVCALSRSRRGRRHRHRDPAAGDHPGGCGCRGASRRCAVPGLSGAVCPGAYRQSARARDCRPANRSPIRDRRTEGYARTRPSGL